VNDPGGEDKARAEQRRRPVQHGIEGFALALGERLGAFCPVAQQVGAGVADDLRTRLVHCPGHAVDRGIEQASRRHVREIERVALPRPFLRDRLHDARLLASTRLRAGVRARRPSRASA